MDIRKVSRYRRILPPPADIPPVIIDPCCRTRRTRHFRDNAGLLQIGPDGIKCMIKIPIRRPDIDQPVTGIPNWPVLRPLYLTKHDDRTNDKDNRDRELQHDQNLTRNGGEGPRLKSSFEHADRL